MSRICNQCSYENKDSASFCIRCGAKLAEPGAVCTQCGAVISVTDERCPNCGAVNGNYKRAQDLAPRTIEELKQWYKDRNLPPEETTRFFIGRDYRGAKAFGIYRDVNGEFVVYKNKDTGDRAVRYRGRDEAFAVNEIYTKLRETIQLQKSRPGYGSGRTASGSASSSGQTNRKKKSKSSIKPIVIFILVIFGIILLSGMLKGNSCGSCSDCGTRKGYYTSDRGTWYYEHGTWFLYNTALRSWYTSSSGPEDYDSYSYSSYSPGGVSSATSSSAYDIASDSWSSSSWDNFWSSDSDYDWDSGSSWDFDFGGGWDSDW